MWNISGDDNDSDDTKDKRARCFCVGRHSSERERKK